MKFLLSLLTFLLAGISGFAQQTELIEYSGITQFNWNLFQGKINKEHLATMGQNTGAVTVSSISYATQQISPNEARVVITARFHTQDSWTKYPHLPNADEALNHEKRHMEITEIYARRLRQLVTKTRFSEKHFIKELDRLFTEQAGKHREEQNRYDRETGHSTIGDQQQNWDKRIDEWMKELEAYSSTTYKISLH
jgi:hypothetical protein